MDQALELVLRISAFIALATAESYLMWSIHKGRLMPSIVWKYLSVVIGMKALFRGLLAFALIDHIAGWGLVSAEVASEIATWQPSINQSMYIMMGFAVILLVYGHIEGRASHYRNHHE